jgi:hypothetical protein
MNNYSKTLLLLVIFINGLSLCSKGQQNRDSLLPVRGLCIDAPHPASLDSFIHFIDKGLAPKKINLLILSIEYHYQFKSHPELEDSLSLSLADVKKIVAVCRKNNIRIIPQIDLLGHQSWAKRVNMLLKRYPQFDETPWVPTPDIYEWPNADNLYCRSYCPLHPDLHKILFDAIDEVCDAFEATAFHGGMDEVFYLGEAKCPRCGGKDRSKLFADEVTLVRDHLASKNRELWIWGDRLIDGVTTGIGIWEGSANDTWRAVDMIPKDVVICDWHYERPDKTAVYFAMKGFRVLTCPWRTPDIAVTQIKDMINFRQQSTPEMKNRFLGVLETTWTQTSRFMDGFYTKRPDEENTSWNTFKVMCDTMDKIE